MENNYVSDKAALKNRRRMLSAGSATHSAVVKRVEVDEDMVGAVGVVAARLGLCGGSVDAMAQTWLRPIVDEGFGSTQRGIKRAYAVVKMLGDMLDGKRFMDAMKESGLKWAHVAAFSMSCPDFDKVFQEVYRIYKGGLALRKEAMGEEVLDAAYELAVNGEEVLDKDGKVIGKKKNAKAQALLMPLAGAEFRKDGGVAAGGGQAADRPAISMTFHFGGQEAPVSVEAVEVKDGA